MNIGPLIKKETLEIFRQKEMLLLIIIVPIIQIILLGYVITTDIRNIPVQIINRSELPEARRLISRIQASPLFDVRKVQLTQAAEVSETFKKDTIKAVMILSDAEPAGFFPFPVIHILVDGVDPNTSLVGAGYMQGMVKHLLEANLSRLGVGIPLAVNTMIRFNPELRSIYYMGPGIVALILTMLTGFLAIVSIVREYEQQTMDVLLASRLSLWEIYLGKMIPPALIGLAEMTLGIGVVTLWFNIPVRGSLIQLLVAAALFLPAILSYSLLISTFSSTQQQAMFFGWFSMVTFLLLSGFFTPVENIPPVIKILAHINPLRYFIQIIREIFLLGNGFQYFWQELAIMALITLCGLSLSLFVFTKRFRH